MSKILILFSGGADSILMLHQAIDLHHDVSLVCFDYGQEHKEELDYANRYIDRYRKLHAGETMSRIDVVYHIDISPAFELTASNLLSRSPNANYPNVHEAHVPGRNTIFISVALSLAESSGFEKIWIGCDYSDRINQFPDCTQEWVVAMDTLAKISGSRPIAVKAPLLGMSKEDILLNLKIRGVDSQEIYSGYAPPEGR